MIHQAERDIGSSTCVILIRLITMRSWCAIIPSLNQLHSTPNVAFQCLPSMSEKKKKKEEEEEDNNICFS